MRRISSTGQDQILVECANGSWWVPVVTPISFEGGPIRGAWVHPGTVNIVCPFTGTIETHGWAPGLRCPHSLAKIDLASLGHDEIAAYYIDCPDPDAPPPADFPLPPGWEMFAEDLEWYRFKATMSGATK